ncbi:MAG: FUSC family protein [Bryobacteraceae bacterium]|nr:FUSC family protein [Bryobacteraceae bacterium]
MTIADAVARSTELSRGYWFPLTVAILLKPDFTATFSRGLLRLAGTFIGLLLATGLFRILPAVFSIEYVLIVVFAFLMRCFGPANYGIFSIAITAMVVGLLAMSGVSPGDAVRERGINTAAGGLLALAAYALWPT